MATHVLKEHHLSQKPIAFRPKERVDQLTVGGLI